MVGCGGQTEWATLAMVSNVCLRRSSFVLSYRNKRCPVMREDPFRNELITL